MPSLNRNEKVTCENCGVQVTKLNLARHKKRCSAGTLYFTQGPNFSTLSQVDINYHIAKQHSNNTVQQVLQKHTSVICVMQNFLALMLYVNTKTLNMENNLGLGQSILMWRR